MGGMLTSTLFERHGEVFTDLGTLSRSRAKYEANAVMAVFLRESSDLFTISPGARAVGDHALGTVFEALLWKAHRLDSSGTEKIVQAYMTWVDNFLDLSAVPAANFTTTRWQLP